MTAVPPMRIQGANVSHDGLYRYQLTRAWTFGGDRVLWVMLNPSTADATHDDPTIRRCIGFTHAWGHGRLDVANLYAYRATKPAALRAALAAGVDVVGPENNDHLGALMTLAHTVVAAWGAHADPARVRSVSDHARLLGVQLQCLGTTASGQPRHPLYVKGDTQLRPWEW